MAVLEAFVHDPLINWWGSPAAKNGEANVEVEERENLGSNFALRGDGDREMNSRAVSVITRISNKLTGIFLPTHRT